MAFYPRFAFPSRPICMIRTVLCCFPAKSGCIRVALRPRNQADQFRPKRDEIRLDPSLTPTFAYFLLSPYFPRFSYGLCVLQIFIFLNGAYFIFNLSYIAVACFEGLLHCRICTMSPNGFLPSVVTSFWVLILRTISVQ